MSRRFEFACACARCPALLRGRRTEASRGPSRRPSETRRAESTVDLAHRIPQPALSRERAGFFVSENLKGDTPMPTTDTTQARPKPHYRPGTIAGQAAQTLALLNLAQAGDSIVSSSALYGGTFTLFQHTFPRLGITTKFVDANDPKEVAAAIDDTTRAGYVETIGNPKLDVPDFEALAGVAHAAGVPLVVDNTFATPLLCRPLDYGADIVLHSPTKWIGGHGPALGGAVVDGGRFDWGKEPRFKPFFTDPEPAYHGISFAEAFGTAAFAVRLRVVLLRDVGATLSPFNAFLFLQGLETLHVRIQRHCENALAVARFLEAHPAVSWVRYPGLPSHPAHAPATRYLSGGWEGR